MLKKAFVSLGAAALLSTLTFGTPVVSYARTGVNWLRQSASDSMPLEWELKRARQLVADLKPEISDAARQIALEKVEVARLENRLEEKRDGLAKSQQDIERLRADLERQSEYYTYAGRTYTSVQVRGDLANRFKRHKTRAATADKLSQMLEARHASLEAANERMTAMLDSRRQLEVEIENLQARLASLRVSQTASDLHIDDSTLSETRQLLDDIAARIGVEEETLHVDAEYFGGIDLEEPTDENLMDEIASYFESSAAVDSDPSMLAIQLD